MRILKLILWLILIVCLTWGGAIVFGPLLISSAVERYSGGVVTLSAVEISPKFEIRIPLVEAKPDPAQAAAFVRGLEIDWRYDEYFELAVRVGSSQVEGLGVAAGGGLTIRPQSLTNWSTAQLSATLDGLRLGQNKASVATLTGSLDLSNLMLTDVDMRLSDVAAAIDSAVTPFGDVSISVSEYALRKAFDAQEFDYAIRLPSGVKKNNIELGAFSALGRVYSGVADIEAEFKGLRVIDRGVTIDEAILASRYDLRTRIFEPEWRIVLSDFKSINPPLELSNYSGTVEMSGEVIELVGRADVQKITLKTADMVLAELNDGEVTLNVVAGPNPQFGSITLDLEGQLQATPSLSVDLSAAVRLDGALPADCVAQACEAIQARVDYTVNADGEVLKGSARCDGPNCASDQFRHRLETSDTDAFMQNLVQSAIFNPLVLPVAYMELRRGQPNGSGHIVEY